MSTRTLENILKEMSLLALEIGLLDRNDQASAIQALIYITSSLQNHQITVAKSEGKPDFTSTTSNSWLTNNDVFVNVNQENKVLEEDSNSTTQNQKNKNIKENPKHTPTTSNIDESDNVTIFKISETNEQPLYDCPKAGCTEKFPQKLLYKHIKSHTEKYICRRLCKLEFQSQVSLNTHNCERQHVQNIKT